MNFFQHEKGVTLIEVIISVAILSIVLISFFNFFPQMGFMNKQNEDKIQGINTAKQIMVKWQNSQDVKDFLVSGNLPPKDGNEDESLNYEDYIPDNTDPDTEEKHYYLFTKKIDDLEVDIKLYKEDELSTSTTANKIHVIVKNKRGNLSESYGYVMSMSD